VSKLFALGVGAQEEMSKGPTDDQINDPTINWSIYRALRAIAPEDITVGGFGSPGSDHYLFAALAADQTVDITPKAPPDYYEGGVSAAELKLRIFDAVTGAELTDKTTTVFVGEQVSLYCLIVTPASAPPTAYQWTIPGFTISNYVATAYSGTVYSNFPTSLTNVVFYWADGATNRAVTCAATVRGQKAVGQAKFNVQRPDAPWILTPKDHVAVDTDYPGSPGYYYLHAGKGNSTNDAGMLYEYHTTDLKGYNRVFQFQFVQIATIDWKINYDLGTSTNYSMYQQMRGLDNGIRPDGSPNSDYFAARWFFQSGYTIDSPGDKLLDSYVFDWRRDSFECYLLFQPQGGNSCPD